MTQELGQLTVGDLIAFKEKRRPTASKVVTLEHNATFGQGLKVLAKYRILSAPMTMAVSLEDMEGGDAGAGAPSGAPTLVGWVDINDILNALLSHVKRLHDGHIPTAMLQLMSALEGAARPFNDRAVITLTGGDDKSLVYETEANAPLLDTVRERLLNSPSENGRVVHRLAVFDITGEVRHIISHLDLIRLLSSRPDALLGDAADQSLEQLGLLPSGPAHVVCVDPHVPTLIALDKMASVGVSGAAVVSSSGQLVANLSTSDLRGIQPEHLGVLALPVAEFLALLHGTTYLGFAATSPQASHPFFANRRPGPPSPGGDSEVQPEMDTVRLITCSRGSSLRDVLVLMTEHNVHRVYVVDPNAKPQVTAVVTPTDVLRWLVRQNSKN